MLRVMLTMLSRLAPVLLVLLILCAMAGPVRAAERWLLVDAASATLSVMHGVQVVQRFDDIAVGRLGIKPLHFAGDTSTPAGEFRIDAINPDSDYTLFFRLDYPTRAHAEKALLLGRISRQEFDRIMAAVQAGKHPPQDTALGGMIGIHGIGRGSLTVHRTFNWTEGCVALDNDQIRRLAGQVFIGMRVVIQ